MPLHVRSDQRGGDEQERGGDPDDPHWNASAAPRLPASLVLFRHRAPRSVPRTTPRAERTAARSSVVAPSGMSAGRGCTGGEIDRKTLPRDYPFGLTSWPLEPFGQAHPVRAYFNDPRIAGTSRSFHFGIDIAAPNGTPVYAVRSGVVHIEGGRSLAVADGDVAFGYWHVIPAVGDRQSVVRGQLLGHIEAPWLHLHFAEHRAGAYLDPLRPGGLAPWRDTTAPRVTKIVLSRNGRALAPAAVSGAVDVIAGAHQMPPIAVPKPWDGLPVTPARVRWRVRRGGTTVRPWHTPIDFSKGLLPQDRFRWIYAPGTRQNHAGKPGLYRFYVAHTWSTELLPDGRYVIEVEASDLYGNRGALELAVTLANDL